MNKRISYYVIRNSREQAWPNALRDKFSENLSKYGVFWFETGSSLEGDFLQVSANLRVDIKKKELWKCTGKDLFNHPYHYLSVALDRDNFQLRDIFDYSSGCTGKDRYLCDIGIKQVNKVVIDVKKSKQLDIMLIPFTLKPKIYLISRRLKEILDENKCTGVEYIPCLEKWHEYSSGDYLLQTENEKIESEASFFQLRILERTINPARVGSFEGKIGLCPVCRTAYDVDFDRTPYFHINDLQSCDFQLYDTYVNKQGEKLTIPGEIVIISSKVLKLFIDNKVKGLRSYYTDPPIKHGVVEIE
jgi:hypothetical protein